MDPQAMAGMMGGQGGGKPAPPVAPGATLKFNLFALLVVYIANNWKLVMALQDMVMKLLQPFLDAKSARAAETAKEEAAAAKAAAAKARAARLKAQASSAPAAADDDDGGEDE